MLTRIIRRWKESKAKKSEAARRAEAEKAEALEKKRQAVNDWIDKVSASLPKYDGYVEYEGVRCGRDGIFAEYEFANARNIAENVMYQRLRNEYGPNVKIEVETIDIPYPCWNPLVMLMLEKNKEYCWKTRRIYYRMKNTPKKAD